MAPRGIGGGPGPSWPSPHHFLGPWYASSSCKIWSQLVKPLLRYGNLWIFQNDSRPSAILELLHPYLNYPLRVYLMVFIVNLLCKIRLRAMKYDILNLCMFGLKKPIYAPKRELRESGPQNEEQCQTPCASFEPTCVKVDRAV